jgi:diguanylate cyclase (GGDEF)-like protein/PAS domain S-box-containing protein
MTDNDKPVHILVVDDAPLIRGLLVQVLQKFGYVIDIAENGQQAIEAFLQQPPDLILMDADMPVMDGVMACAQIKQLPAAKYLPIVMVTSYIEREWVDRAYAAGATDYVTKPINWDVLRNRIHYILQAKQAEEALFKEKEKAQVTLASIGDGVITTDANGQVEYLNAVATKLTGWRTEEAHGLPLNQILRLIDENTQQPLEFPLRQCLEEGQIMEFTSNTVLVHRDQRQQFAIEDSAAPIRDRKGRIIGIVLVFHDVTDSRKMTQELSYKAKHDALTGLYNRHEFEAQLQRIRQSSLPQGTTHALLYMDLDQFKIVNDTCGHEAGDQLLKDVALLLLKRIDEQTTFARATLARLGGDEFGLLLEHCSLSHSLAIANQLCQTLDRFRFFWGNEHTRNIFSIGLSIGLVPISTHNIHQPSLLVMADTACYAAKNAGRNTVHVYQETDALPQNKTVQWVSAIQDNLDKEHGFSLYYQPIKSLHDTSPSNLHYEILLRMDNEQGQLVNPGAFLPAAMRYNLMPNLDLWVIRTVFAWLTSHPQHLEKLTFNMINISSHSLSDNHFLSTVLSYFHHSSLPAHKFCFEIKETTAITNFTSVLTFITTLKPLGCRFALDNFGSGMASCSHLKNIPLDFLKIDGTLIKDILNDPIDYTMVKSINEIAHLMHLQTIAEHVESAAIVDQLKVIQVDYIQGYWVGRPQPLS